MAHFGSESPFINQSGIGQSFANFSSSDPWQEVDGYKEHFRQDDIQVVRMFRVAWNLRGLFVNRMLGYSTSQQQTALQGGGSQVIYRIKRVIPAQHPERPWLYADSVELMKGEGAIRNNANTFATDANGNIIDDTNSNAIALPMIEYFDQSGNGDGQALMAVRYTFRDYEILSDDDLVAQWQGNELGRWVTQTRKYSVQSLALPGKGVIFNDPNAPAAINGTLITQTGVGIIMPVVDYQYAWHQVPDVPEAAIDACVGFVNSQPFDGISGRRQFAPGTLLCMAPSTDRIRTAVGRVAWEIKYHLLYRATGWNNYPASDGNFYRVNRTSDGTTANGVPVYPSADFSQLFGIPASVIYQ